MKRRAAALVVLVIAAVVVLSVLQRPRRARPDGYDAPWAALPVDDERAWAGDATRREVVTSLFVEAREAMQHCNEELYRAQESGAVTIELLLVQERDGMRLQFARAEALPQYPQLGPCLERALEATGPAPNPGVAVGTVWRLSAKVLLHPEHELPPIPWWHRFVPPSWRSGGDSAIHIG